VSDLVLRIRVEVLRSNLNLVSRTLTTLREPQSRTDTFLDLPYHVGNALVGALDTVSQAKSSYRTESYEDEHLWEALENLEQKLDTLRREMQKLRAQAIRERTRARSLTNVRKDLQDFLITKAGEISLEEDWDTYRRKAKDCQELFKEYVDVLQGIALRDAGFDSNLFRIADRLPSLWRRPRGYSWQSMAIPSSQERLDQSAARVLRVGFPEWTVFALPLLQHEFGHVFLRLTPLQRLAAAAANATAGADALGDLGVALGASAVGPADGDPTAAICIADAAALCVTGPAYACSVLFMRLDPADVRTASDLTTLRAAVILEALKIIAASSSDDNPLTLVYVRLAAEWHKAVSARGDIDAMRAAELSEEVSSWVREAWQVVTTEDSEGKPKLPHWAEHWGIAYDWSAEFRRASGPGAGPAVIDVDSVRSTDDTPFALGLVLNAAWMVRVGPARAADDPSPGTPDVTDPTEIERVGLEAVRCCLEIVDRLEAGPSAPAAPSRPAAAASKPRRSS
jgi:hypothetical protein